MLTSKSLIACAIAVQCPVGTFFSLEHHECASCWLGSYQDQEGQLECKSCPEGTSTAYLHSRSVTECKGKTHSHGQTSALFRLCLNIVQDVVICLCLQGSVSLAVTLWTGWRSASHARWVTSSLVLAPGSVSSALTRPRPSPEEQWTRQSVEVTQFDSVECTRLMSYLLAYFS